MKDSNSNQEALDLKKEINRLEMRKFKYCSLINAKIHDLQEKFEKSCIHNEMVMEYKFEPGSYYDQCKYINQTVCKVCGKILEKDIRFGGYG